MSQFDPDTFMNQETTEATESKFTPIPEGEYQAVIDDVESGVTPNKSVPYLRVMYEILDDDVKRQLNLEKPLVRQTIFLDLNESGGLDTGPNKNVKLGKLRDAVGQNQSGQPWSPIQLKGAGPLTIYVTERKDDNDPEIVYNDVKRVTKAQ